MKNFIKRTMSIFQNASTMDKFLLLFIYTMIVIGLACTISDRIYQHQVVVETVQNADELIETLHQIPHFDLQMGAPV